MIPVDQIIFEDGRGDCLRACVASIIEVPVSEVPNFAEDGSFRNGAVLWLEARGYKTLTIDFSGDGYCHEQFIRGGGASIFSGLSPRHIEGTPGRRKGHAVVGKFTGWGFEILHDPHPSRAGIAGKPNSVMWIFGGLNG